MIEKNKNKKSKNLALTGGGAVAEALRQIEPEVMPIYPITPQTPIIETYAKFEADGKVDTEIIKVESEHSAISAAVGASTAGARTVTATSSQGLAYMHEVLYIASGMRLPILMVVAARALSAPINIHGDHSDVMGARDSGWMQIFCENAQEVYDQTIIGMKLAEEVALPIMVIMDGFSTSHSVENLETLDDKTVKKFVGEYKAKNALLDIENPVTFGPVALQNSYFEFKIDQEKVMEKVAEKYQEIAKEYQKITQRKYDFFEAYKTEDAQRIMILAGSSAGTAKMAVDILRFQGEKVGLIKINLFRPFENEKLSQILQNCQEIFVLDRAQSIGTKPPFYMETINSLYLADNKKKIKSYIYGLGGRDLFQKQIEEIFEGKFKGKYLT
ncbi:MAG: pyruvate ferredoxin oxidoreductase [Candidatus Moranbacteria bacterium CG08_land_8_20_14_0_20_34_16]|nr:MAG: pyruvate ferredoxin oxidoreductase [Candidatus Moranbacteria bacterium CG08_land_8_20_14_0_20_34_16]